MRHLTLLLLSVFTVHQTKADILIPLDKYPTGEKRFNLQINGSHDTLSLIHISEPTRH